MAPILGPPMPLYPIHILWINLVTDGQPGLAYSAELAEKGVMQNVNEAISNTLVKIISNLLPDESSHLIRA
jgi:magnesium-transporting ATPase (P-type)